VPPPAPLEVPVGAVTPAVPVGADNSKNVMGIPLDPAFVDTGPPNPPLPPILEIIDVELSMPTHWVLDDEVEAVAKLPAVAVIVPKEEFEPAVPLFPFVEPVVLLTAAPPVPPAPTVTVIEAPGVTVKYCS
jgi:hypothetical protein